MICKFCGNEIDNNSDFCFICGQKVEPQQPAAVAEPVANVYSQPAEPVAPAVPEAVQAAAPVYAAPAAPEAAAPVYAAPAAPAAAPVYAAPAAPASAPAAPVKSKKELKKEKKLAKKAAAAACPVSKAQKFFSFLFALVGLILYSKAKKNNETEKAVIILNSLMTGLCFKMGIVIIVMIKKFMFS